MPKIRHHLLSDRRNYDARVDLRAHRSFKLDLALSVRSNFFGSAAAERLPVAEFKPLSTQLQKTRDESFS